MNADLLLFLIPLLYFLSELLNRAKERRQAEEMPEQQQSDPVLQDLPKVPRIVIQQTPSPAEAVKAPSTPSEVTGNLAPQPVQEKSGWSNKLDPSFVVNGVIFAEIIQPPRAMRPLEPRFARRR